MSNIPASIDFFGELPEYDISMYEHKKMKTTTENSLENLKAALPVLEGIDLWENDLIYNTLMELVQRLGIKNSQLLWPIRTALSGKNVTPGGATELAEILGKNEALRRIVIGIEKLNGRI